MDAKIFRVNYKSDFILTLTSDAGWMTPFCIKFWTGSPMLAYYASYDGETYTHCTYDPSEPTKLTVQFDDHNLPIGNLKYQVAYHFTVADFPENTEDEVTNQANVTTVIDGDTYQVMLDLNGETAPEIQFALPAYANELQRIQNEQTRIAQEQQRVEQEQQRVEQEQTRINQEAVRVTEFNGIKAEALADHQRANEDHSQALSDHQNALADRSQAASDHSRAQSDHSTASSDHLQANSDHSRAQSDHNTALSDHQTALSDHTQANTDHTRAESDHTRATADSSTAAADHRTASTDHTQANTDHARAESDHQRVETDLAEVEEFSNSLGPYDISAAHATGSTLATYPDLATALGTNGSNIPEALRKGGMSVRFVLTYDNNSTQYVQYRLMSDEFSTNTAQWQGVDAEPIAGSKSLVESGGTFEKVQAVEALVAPVTITPSYSETGYYVNNNGVYTSSGSQTSEVVYVLKGTGLEITFDSGVTLRYGIFSSKPAEGDSTSVYGLSVLSPTTIDAPVDGYLVLSHMNTKSIAATSYVRTVDDTPTDNSDNLVKSGGVYNAIHGVAYDSKYGIYTLASEDFYLNNIVLKGSGTQLSPVHTMNGYWNGDVFVEHETVKTYVFDLSAVKAVKIDAFSPFGSVANNKIVILASDYKLIGGMPYTPYVGKIIKNNNFYIGFTPQVGSSLVLTSYSDYDEQNDYTREERLGLIGKRINGFDDVVLDVENLFDCTTDGNLVKKFVNPANGGIYDTSATNTSDFIPVEAGQTYSYNGDACYAGTTVPSMRFIAGYDSNKEIVENAFNPNTYINTVIIPNGVSYVRFSYPIASKTVVFVKGEKPVLQIMVGNDNIKNDSVSFEKVSFKSLGGMNILTPELIVNRPGYYINITDGEPYKLSGGTADGYTDYIPIDSRGLYTNAIYLAGAIIGGAYYNSDKEYISGFRSNSIPYVSGAAYVRFSLTSTITDRLVKVGTDAAYYEPIKEVISKEVLPDAVYEILDIDMPSVINAVVGDTLQIFYICMLRCVNPYVYDISVICDIGSQYPRYFEVTPTSEHIGNHNITITVRRPDGIVIASKTLTLKVSDTGSNPQSAIKVLCLGASGTNAQTWPREFNRRLTGSGGSPAGLGYSTIEFVGSKVATDGTKYEASGGFSWSSYLRTDTKLAKFWFNEAAVSMKVIHVGDVYSFDGHNYEVSEINIPSSDGGYYGYISCKYTETTVSGQSGTLTLVSGTGESSLTFAYCRTVGNPFVYNGEIDIDRYANDYCDGGIDVVCTELFGNAMRPYMTDYQINQLFDTMKQVMEMFIAYNPNIKFLIGLQWPTDIKGGTGKSYGATGGYSLTNGIKFSVMRLCSMLEGYLSDNSLDSNAFIINWLNEFDLENSYHYISKPVNVRAVVNSTYGTTAITDNQFGDNGIHPSNIGYLQMADSAWRCFVSNIL